MTPAQKGANTRRWNRLVSECTPNDQEELKAFKEFLNDDSKTRAEFMEKWGDYCGFTPEEQKEPQ